MIVRELREDLSLVVLLVIVLLFLVFLLGADYKRSSFRHWIDADRDCQDTRAEVLIAQAYGEVGLSPDGCRVVEGRWVDPYSGELFLSPSALDIDHVVPLRHAWEHGADQWSRDKREAYANWQAGLLAVSASLNRQKGQRGPTEWLPPGMDRCDYVERWIAVKRHWNLALSVEEAEMWLECRGDN